MEVLPRDGPRDKSRTRMVLRSERCFEAESGMRRVGIKGWVVFRSFGPCTSEAPNPPFLVTEPGEGHGTFGVRELL